MACRDRPGLFATFPLPPPARLASWPVAQRPSSPTATCAAVAVDDPAARQLQDPADRRDGRPLRRWRAVACWPVTNSSPRRGPSGWPPSTGSGWRRRGLSLPEPGCGRDQAHARRSRPASGAGSRPVRAFLEERAKAVGYGEAWLETGSEQPDAISLYPRAGYRTRPAYGEFKDEPRGPAASSGASATDLSSAADRAARGERAATGSLTPSRFGHVDIDAKPDRILELVSDGTQIGRFRPRDLEAE